MSSPLPVHPSLPLRQSPPNAPYISNATTVPPDAPLDAYQHARQIVRLIQCWQCSHPLREPVTLPCANTLCKNCIPELHVRTYISYPATANRLQGFTCPFTDCGKEHAVGDCKVDVALNKIMDIIRTGIADYSPSQPILEVEVKTKWAAAGLPSLQGQPVQRRRLAGGRLATTYKMAEIGELPHDSEVTYRPIDTTEQYLEYLDVGTLDRLRDALRSELDCQVCYGLFLDPVTTTCGHTLCRKCLHRVQDHSNLCPICRRALSMPPGASPTQAPSNILLRKLISGLCHEALAERVEVEKSEEKSTVGELDTALFICTLSFPCTPTFLHIFEPRYRLMIRRAVESGDRKFGMILHNSEREPQGDLGAVPFYQYGTMLHIVTTHMMPDGRSIIETTGVYRFRVLRYGTLDGYTVGKVERLDDMSVAEEEAQESTETSHVGLSRNSTTADPPDFLRYENLSIFTTTPEALHLLPTQQLMNLCTAFVKRMRDASAPWLHNNVVNAYGACPDDPALFPWWFASVIPTSEVEKYRMLKMTSVRERLKLCVLFAADLEQRRCGSSSCNVL